MFCMLSFKAVFHLSQKSTRKLTASIFIQSQCPKVYFNEMKALAASLQVGFAVSGKEPLYFSKKNHPHEKKTNKSVFLHKMYDVHTEKLYQFLDCFPTRFSKSIGRENWTIPKELIGVLVKET